jgi:hypothetical protein
MKLRGLHVVALVALWFGVATSQGCGGKVDVGPGGSSSGTSSSGSSGTGSSGVGSSSGTSSSSGVGSSSSGVGSSSSVSSGGPVPVGCVTDPTLRCTGDSLGVSCPAGDVPQNPGIICSDPSPQANGTDGYCCVPWKGTACSADQAVTGCTYPSYGISCTAGNTPDESDPALVCSTPVPDPTTGLDIFCCEDLGPGTGSSSGATGSCAADSSLACATGTDGVDCSGGANPEVEYPGYVCSTPSPQADGTDGYCCATGFSGSTCTQDTTVQGCQFPSVGFSCAGTDAPDQADPSLTCSTGVADPTTGDTLYCCD